MSTLEQDVWQPFLDKALITDVVSQLKSGKEASVYLARAHPDTGDGFFALKVYHELTERGFRNDAVYQEGRVHGKGRERRAYDNKTEFGQDVQFALWVGREWHMLNILYFSGVCVPEPVHASGRALLMELYGREGEPAPRLHELHPSPAQCRVIWEHLLAGIERMLAANVVHGDLSPYNLLVDLERGGDPLRIIDLPQAVDARTSPSALALLRRDVANVGRFLGKHGLEVRDRDIADDLWRRYLRAEL
jgi:RIO kinase 1